MLVLLRTPDQCRFRVILAPTTSDWYPSREKRIHWSRLFKDGLIKYLLENDIVWPWDVTSETYKVGLVKIRDKWRRFVWRKRLVIFSNLRSADVSDCFSMDNGCLRSFHSYIISTASTFFLCGLTTSSTSDSLTIEDLWSNIPPLAFRFVATEQGVIILPPTTCGIASRRTRRWRFSFFDSGHYSLVSKKYCPFKDPWCCLDSAVKVLRLLTNLQRVRFVTDRFQIETCLQIHLWEKLIQECVQLERPGVVFPIKVL